jgi:uncharacterized membrane protein YkgB
MTIIALFEKAASMDRMGIAVTRIGLIVVLLWIGGLKAFKYEADGIIPFVANSPFMSFFLSDPENYTSHKKPRRCARTREPGLASAKRNLFVRVRFGKRDRSLWVDALHASVATSGRGCR